MPGTYDIGGEQAFICITCGTQYPPSTTPPEHCPICEDDRQYVHPRGQLWTTLAELRGRYHNRFDPLEPGVQRFVTEPAGLGIGQLAYLIETPHGNWLWETLAYVDETTIAQIQRRGGVEGIAISHAHYYATMVEWSRALGGVPIHLHEANRPWVMRPDPAVRFFEGETLEVLPGLTIIRCGGHFPGGQVLHWAGGAEGAGVLFSGDVIQVVADRRWVTFMYSYPNSVPLSAGEVRHVVEAVEPYPFERLYGAFDGHIVYPDAKGAVRRSSERYIQHITSDDV
jgi:hypothetical protein